MPKARAGGCTTRRTPLREEPIFTEGLSNGVEERTVAIDRINKLDDYNPKYLESNVPHYLHGPPLD